MPKSLQATAARAVCSALITFAAMAPALAQAQRAADDWKFSLAVYGYFPSIGGATNFPPREGGSSVDVDINTILENLKFAFMGNFAVQKGQWGGFVDAVYMDVGGSKQNTRDINVGGLPLPIGTTTNTSFDLKGGIYTVAGTYRAYQQPDAVIDYLFGARALSIKPKLEYEINGQLGPGQGVLKKDTREESVTNWDGIIGVKGRSAFGANREWFIPWYLDAGAGDSHFTWQAYAGLGYSFTWGELFGVWRYIDYDMKSNQAIKDLTFNGPAIGVAFRW